MRKRRYVRPASSPPLVIPNMPDGIEKGDTLADYDALPRSIRDVLKYAPLDYSESDIKRDWRRSGMRADGFDEVLAKHVGVK